MTENMEKVFEEHRQARLAKDAEDRIAGKKKTWKMLNLSAFANMACGCTGVLSIFLAAMGNIPFCALGFFTCICLVVISVSIDKKIVDGAF